jgi:hypothetical protein
MTDAEYERRKRLKSRQYMGSHSTEYPEFGELFVMLLKLLAEYFGSKFQGISLAQTDNDQDNNSTAAMKSSTATIDPEVDELLRDFTPARTFTPLSTTSKTATQLPVEVTASSTYTSNRPSV